MSTVVGLTQGDHEINPTKQNLQDSNPFKIKVSSVNSNPFQAHMDECNPFQAHLEESNPFQISLGQNNQPALFLGKQESEQERGNDIFHEIIEKSERENLFKRPSFIPKITKTQSKIEGVHIEQNVKKYKDILRGLYNDKYWKRAKNFEDTWKRMKKDSSNQNISQEIRKPDACFKANRLVFTKENKTKANLYQKIEEYYLVRHSRERREFMIYQLKQPNINYLKPVIMKSSENEDIAYSVEYDMMYGRLFYFSNSRQQLVVISTKDKEIICRVKTKCQRVNPLLHINKYKSSLYLLVIGGYRILNDSIVEGCKYIQIFSIDKWEVSLKQVVLKLGIGRICPIIFSCDHEKEPSVFILGGCSNASLRKKQIIFNIDEDINFSTNQTAVRIESSFIEDCFMSDDQNNSLLINNMNVRFDNPLQLYGGYVLFRKLVKAEKLELFFSGKKQIYTIKTLKNDVHIIESQLALASGLKAQIDGSINRSIGYHRDLNNTFQLYQIDQNGKLCLQSVHLNPKKNRSKEDQIQCLIM